MRTTTAKIDSAVAGPVFAPAYLVELQFSETIRACTRGQVDWDGQQWYQAGVKVGSIVSGQGGSKSVTVSMANNAMAISQIVLAEAASGKRVRIWKLFGEPPYATEDASLVFTGLIDDVPELRERVTFNCSTQNSRTLLVPNVTIGPPFFNYLPRPGQTVTWGEEVFELQPR